MKTLSCIHQFIYTSWWYLRRWQIIKKHRADPFCANILTHLLRFRIPQKASQLALFSFSLSLQQIWTDWRKLLVEFSIFVKLDKWRNSDKREKSYMRSIHSNLKFRVWKQDIPCALVKITMTEVSGHVFHDVNSILNTVSNIHPKTRVLRKLSIFSEVKS